MRRARCSAVAGASSWQPGAALVRRTRGFTLVEMVIAIALIGLLSVMAAPLLRIPLAAWMDASRRADLGASTDLVQGKLAADLARALPGSVRVRQIGSRVWLEYLEVRAQGRHRAGLGVGAPACPAACNAPGGNDMLEAACSESCFTTLGPLLGDAPVPGTDWVVVNPLGPAVPGANPYFGGSAAVAGGIKTRLLGTAAVPGGTRLQLAAHNFPAIAASRRFYLVAQPVSLECNPTTQRLTRHTGYAIAALQPTAFAGAQSVPVADNVAACSLRFTPAGALARSGVVSVWLRLARAASDTGAPESIEFNGQYAVSEAP
jgi:MSHA biogenesis protein MshO